MKIDEIEKLVARFNTSRFQIRALYIGGARGNVDVMINVPEIATRKCWMISRTVDLTAEMSEEEAVKKIREAIVDAVMHEIDEALYFDGKQLVLPHPEMTR